MSGLRVFVLAQDGTLGREVGPASMLSAVRTEEINADVSLALELCEPMEKGLRVLVRSADGSWREYEVMGVKAKASADGAPTWAASLVWTLYGDLDACMQGALKMPKGPVAALEQVVEGTCWEVGEVGVSGTSAVGMYYESKWECLSAVVEAFGGEVRADIDVGATGVVSRRLSLPSKLGSRTCARRFDWGSDLTAVSRSVDEEPVYARVVPRGKGEESGDGYGRRVTIADANGGREWIEDEEAALAFRRPDGKGGWAYPTKVVVNESVEDPAELLAWGRSVLHDYTRPKVTYSASVLQLARAGMDTQGVALGDAVQCVDRGFGPDGLRVEGRVVKVEADELDPTDTRLTIGRVAATLTDDLEGLRHDVSQVRHAAEGINGGGLDPAGFMQRLLGRINAEMNATGGYTYLKPGEGIWVYDRAEDQGPTMAVNVVGGGVRVASSKTADGQWDWRTVMTAGDGVVADQVCTGTLRGGSNTWNLSTGDLVFEQGVIRSADGRNYWNLSTGEFSFQGVASEADAIKSVDVEYALGASQAEAPATGWSTAAPAWQVGKYMWQRTKTVSGTGEVLYSDPTCIQGAKGADGAPGEAGADGKDGTPGKDGKDALPVYFHRAYAMNADGSQGFTITWKDGCRYFGTYVDNTPADSADPTKYDWTLFVGKDGAEGTPGKDGASGTTYYLHIAYATSADGSQGFSVDDPAGKTYIGQCVDTSKDDPTTPASYTWALIKGADGADGADGIGISSIQEQYYLSTSSTAQAGGSWSPSQPAWVKGRHYWTRSKVTWSDGKVTYTTPQLARALTSSNQAASDLDTKLTQEEIFNRLTDGGQTQGIYLQDGKVYLNGEYIKAGSVAVSRLESSQKLPDGSAAMTLSATSGPAGTIATGGSKQHWPAYVTATTGPDADEFFRIVTQAGLTRLFLAPLDYQESGTEGMSGIAMRGRTGQYQYYVEIHPSVGADGEVALKAKMTDNSAGYWASRLEKTICVLNK